MNVRERRGFRGAFRETPEEILYRAIAAHKALRDREQLQAALAKPGRPTQQSAKRKADKVDATRAQFAEAMARSEFGRFYFKPRPNGKEKK